MEPLLPEPQTINSIAWINYVAGLGIIIDTLIATYVEPNAMDYTYGHGTFAVPTLGIVGLVFMANGMCLWLLSQIKSWTSKRNSTRSTTS